VLRQQSVNALASMLLVRLLPALLGSFKLLVDRRAIPQRIWLDFPRGI
jgi:hypothetical protein